MAKDDEWNVVETKPATADDWKVIKKAPSDTAQSTAPAINEEPPTEAERISAEPQSSANAPAAKAEGNDNFNSVKWGAGFGAVKGLLEKYLLSNDKLQRDIYARAIKNTLLKANIYLPKNINEAELIDMARNLSGKVLAGEEARLAALEQQAAQYRGMLPPEPPISTGFPSPLEDLAQAGRTAGSEVKSGPAKWIESQIGAGEEIPFVKKLEAEGYRKDTETGGQRIIDEDRLKRQRLAKMGAADYRLAGQGRGQLMLPPEAAGEVNAQVAAQEAAMAAERAKVAKDALRIIQPQIAAVQAEINRLQAMGRDVSAYTQRLEELHRMQGLAQRQLKSGVIYPQQAQIGFFPRNLSKFGSAMGGQGFLPMASNVISGAGAFYDIGEAFDRASNKDPLGAAVHAVSGILNTMAMVPPTSIPLATTKSIGILGSIPMMGVKAAMSPPPKTDVKQITQPGGLMQVAPQVVLDYLYEKFPSLRPK